jgi:hypothetical protein
VGPVLVTRRGWMRGLVGSTVLLLAACGTMRPQPAVPVEHERVPSASPAPVQPPLPINLSGYPPSFKAGFRDGCDSFRVGFRRDATRFNSDANYATGWQDGFSICRRRGK